MIRHVTCGNGFVFVWLLCATAPVVQAANRYWVGSGNWNDTAHWSTNAGGAGGASVPGTADTAIFTTGSTNCTVNQAVDCGGMLLTNYAGTLTFSSAHAVQVQSTFSQYSGTIVCGTNRVTFYNCNWLNAGGVFTHTNGWVRFHNSGVSAGKTIKGKPAFDRVSFYASGGGGTYPWFIVAGSTVTVSRMLLFEGTGYNRLDTGTVVVAGDVVNSNNTVSANATLRFAGIGNQALYGTAASYFPHLVIAKPSGTLNLSGTVRTARNWTHLSGSVSPGTSTVILHPHASFGSGITSTTGRATFYNLAFDQAWGGGVSYYYTLRGGMTLVVSNTLSFGLANIFNAGTLYEGTIEALGNVQVNVAYGNSTTILAFKGAGAQLLQGSQSANAASPPPVVVDKPTGNLTLGGTFSLVNRWTHLAGTVDPGTSHTWLYAANPARVVLTSAVGRVTFYDVRVDQAQGGGNNYFITIADGTTLVVTNQLSFDPNSGWRVNGGPVEVHGNIRDDGVSSVLGTSLLRIAGSGTHQWTGVSPFTSLDLDMELRKSAGLFTLTTPLICDAADQDLTVVQGALDLSTNALNLSGIGSDFQMTGNDAMLRCLVTAVTNGRVTVAGVTRIDGALYVDVPKGTYPDRNRTNVIVTGAAAIQNAPFDMLTGTDNYRYRAFYNTGGNRVHITRLHFMPTGTVLLLQ